MGLWVRSMFFLSEEDVERTVATFGVDHVMDLLIEAVRSGFASMAHGEFLHERRAGFSEGDNLIEWMPVREPDSAVIKVVSYFPNNPGLRHLPTIGASVMRVDANHGQITHFVGARLLTAMRTGAASAVASSLLASERSSVLGLVGCGLQAVTQTHALSRVFSLSEVLAFDVEATAMETISARLAFTGLKVSRVNLEAIQQNCDIICTATTAAVGAEPVLGEEGLAAHAHINAVGSDFPGKKELPAALVRSARVTTDYLPQARLEGECQSLSDEHFSSDRFADLQAITANPAKFAVWRPTITLFDSTGIAMEDAVALDVICKLAKRAGIGRSIPMLAENDPKNPYGRLKPLREAVVVRALLQH